MSGPGIQLSDRAQTILRLLVENYVRDGQPVGSRSLSRDKSISLSPATIRNVMADLEELGLLRQPHTSAGRVPTETAYRLYVEHLMRFHQLTQEERTYIERSLKNAGDTDQMMAAVTHLLSELSSQIGVVLIPAVEDVVLKSADFVSLGGRRVLCVVVATSGLVDHLVVETEEELSREELTRVSNYMTELFSGVRLGDVRDRLVAMMDADREQVDRLLSRTVDLARQAIGASPAQEVLVEGTTALLDQPELADLAQVRRMLDTMADKARLVKLLNKCLASDGVRVFLGDDSDVTSELEFSLVATTYGTGETALGSLGIIGPSRMEYRRVVPLVRYLGDSLSKALEAAGQGR